MSAPPLETIFYPGNPLHDGAVIIKNGQIVSAGCVLPQSAKRYTKEAKKIGTRHRASLGISERTDALGIVVSKETNKFSIAQQGILHPIEINMVMVRHFPHLTQAKQCGTAFKGVLQSWE